MDHSFPPTEIGESGAFRPTALMIVRGIFAEGGFGWEKGKGEGLVGRAWALWACGVGVLGDSRRRLGVVSGGCGCGWERERERESDSDSDREVRWWWWWWWLQAGRLWWCLYLSRAVYGARYR